MNDAPTPASAMNHHVRSDIPFFAVMGSLAVMYVLLIIVMLLVMATHTSPGDLLNALRSPAIQAAVKLSLLTATITTIVSLWIAVPIGYLMSRSHFRGKTLVDGILDVPIILPPLVVGLALLVLFNRPWAGGWRLETFFGETLGTPVTYAVPAIVLAQFVVACALAVRAMRITFDRISPRTEQVAMTLGCNRGHAFFAVVLPEAGRGVLTAATLAWARSLGEFGPILIFAGATRMRTEVLPTTIFLELNVGNIEAAIAVSLIMVTAALMVLLLARGFGERRAMR